MVLVNTSRKKSTTQIFLEWLERSEESPEEALIAIEASQKTLLCALRAVVGEAKSLTYQLTEGVFVKLCPESDEGMSLEFAKENSPASAAITELYELYLPLPSENESSMGYHSRLLEGLDLLVDEIACGQLVELIR